MVGSKPTVKYLGIAIELKTSYFIRIISDKAAARMFAIILANIGGLVSSTRRRLLIRSFHSAFLYHSEEWASVSSKQMHGYNHRKPYEWRSPRAQVSQLYWWHSYSDCSDYLVSVERKFLYVNRGEEDKKTVAREQRVRTLSA